MDQNLKWLTDVWSSASFDILIYGIYTINYNTIESVVALKILVGLVAATLRV